MRGVVNFGYGFNLIGYRWCRRIYGFEIIEWYDVIKYELYCFIRMNGENCCYKVFKKIVEKNELLKVNEIWIEMVGIELDWDGNL